MAVLESGIPAVVEVLLDAGADPHMPDGKGETPLHLAMRNKFDAASIVEVLLKAGADPKVRDHNGNMPLHGAAARSGSTVLFMEDAPGRSRRIVEALLDVGADPEARNEDGETPLHIAAAFTQTSPVVVALVDAGADPEARDGEGWTALHRAGTSATVPVVEALLDAGADLEAHNEEGWTPLHRAAAFATSPKMSAVMLAMLDTGADPGARTEAGERPRDLIGSDSPLKRTTVYWRLQDARQVARPGDRAFASMPAVAADCDEWNTREFFETATLETVTACLDFYADPNAVDGGDNTP